MPTSCLNCGLPLDARFAYCSSCGQKTATRRLHLREIAHEAWMQFTDIDRGLFTLLRDLIIRPGTVAREYIAGRRKAHFAPLNFYLIVGTIMIVVMSITARIREHAPPAVSGSTAIDERIAKMRERQQVANAFWREYSNVVAIAAAPLFALFFWMFYRRAGLNYTEHLVACLYMIGFTNLVYALIIIPLTSILSSVQSVSYGIAGAFKLFEIMYFTLSYAKLTHDKVTRPRLRAALVSALVALLWVALTSSLMAVYITTGFWMDRTG